MIRLDDRQQLARHIEQAHTDGARLACACELAGIDVLRDLEKEGKIGKLYHVFYSTVGNGTSVANARKFGTEIGSQLKAAHVDGVILTST